MVTAVSDASALIVGASSHWSLLVYWPDAGAAAHFDSLPGPSRNAAAAAAALAKLRRCLKAPPASLASPPTPRQTNGHDCGAFALAIAREITADAGAGPGRHQLDAVTPAAVADLRADCRRRAAAMFDAAAA